MSVAPEFPRAIAVMLGERERDIHRELIVNMLRSALPTTRVQCASAVEELVEPTDLEVLVTPVQPWIEKVVADAPNLKWIHFLSSGVDGLWSLSFDKSRYLLSKSSGVHAIPMAEYVIGSILYFLKGFHIYHRQQRAREWARHWLDEAFGKSVTVVGLGAIGQEIARRCKQMGMKVTGVATRVRGVDYVDTLVTTADLRSALTSADFVVVCVPLTEQTRGLLSRPVLEAMKVGAYLIDISRGTIVDQAALVDLIKRGHIGGAVIDVFEKEPLPADSPLWDLENVLITPHVSGTTPFYMERAINIFLQNLESLRTNGALVTPVDLRRMY